MDFYEILGRYKGTDLLFVPEYDPPTFRYEKEVVEAFKDIFINKKRTLYYGDYDADGAYCLEILKDTSRYVGFDNFEVFPYSRRTHSVDSNAVNRAITGNFEYMVICDAGSADPNTMARLASYGVKVILLDHHQSAYDYEHFPDTIMINTAFENREREKNIVCSAGSLTYMVCEKVLEFMGLKNLESNAALALASLYADVIDMSDPLCRAIYYKAISLKRYELPNLIQRFLSDNLLFNRRFIEFHLNPRLNSLFRSEKFDILNKLLSWTPGNGVNLSGLLETVIAHHAENSEECAKAADLMEVELLNNFVIGNLSSVVGQINLSEKTIANYTGYVASKLTTKYRKTAVVFADTGREVKGSLRDPYSRNYLDVFKTFCNANGHNAAFGIHVSYLDFSEFLSYIRMVDSKYAIKSVGNEPIIVPHNLEIADKDIVMKMALYNEFSGMSFPSGYLSKIWVRNYNEPYSTKWDHYYRWGEFSVKSKTKIRLGSELILKPQKGNSKKNDGVQLLVHEIIGR